MRPSANKRWKYQLPPQASFASCLVAWGFTLTFQEDEIFFAFVLYLFVPFAWNREDHMLKVSIGITGAVVLLLVGISAWNAKATPLSGIVGVQPKTTYPLLQKAACDEADSRCEKGKAWTCPLAATGPDSPDCACLECDSGEKARCPDKSICAPPGTCRMCVDGWKCCR
jgi:hypothetical protein